MRLNTEVNTEQNIKTNCRIRGISLLLDFKKKQALTVLDLLLYQTDQCILDRDKTIKSMGEANKFGLMAPDTMVCGRTIKQMVLELWFTQTVISMRECGSMTRHMDMAFTNTPMVPLILANGSKTNNTAKALKHGLTVQGMKACTKTGKKMARAF